MEQLHHPEQEKLEPIREVMSQVPPDMPIVILSDFDHTLCDEYTFNPSTNNHLPQIDPGIIDAAQKQHLVVATGRRANNPAIPELWRSGLIPAAQPVIAENGGVLVHSQNGQLIFEELITQEQIMSLQQVENIVKSQIGELPPGQRLIFKKGLTMQLARLQDEDGTTTPEHQSWLAERISFLNPDPALQVVDTRASVTIQHKTVDKRFGFEIYLQSQDISRAEIFVVGMGDGPNDKEIFETADLALGFSQAVRSLVDVPDMRVADVRSILQIV